MLDYSDEIYKISFEALMKFIMSMLDENAEIIIKPPTSTVHTALVMITVKNSNQNGGCFYDFKDREAYQMTQNWASVLDKILQDKVNESVSAFSEEAYNLEKGEINKNNWCSFNMMSD